MYGEPWSLQHVNLILFCIIYTFLPLLYQGPHINDRRSLVNLLYSLFHTSTTAFTNTNTRLFYLHACHASLRGVSLIFHLNLWFCFHSIKCYGRNILYVIFNIVIILVSSVASWDFCHIAVHRAMMLTLVKAVVWYGWAVSAVRDTRTVSVSVRWLRVMVTDGGVCHQTQAVTIAKMPAWNV